MTIEDVTAPYTPIDNNGRRIPVVTASFILNDILFVFSSILKWRGHIDAMAKSQRHASVMMGEMDDPDENEGSAYNPLATAGWFGILLAVERARSLFLPSVPFRLRKPDQILFNREQIKRDEAIIIFGCLVQLLFALLRDDEAIAEIARYKRTGYIGTASQQDKIHGNELKTLIQSLVHRSVLDEFEECLQSGKIDIPLMYRNAPILVPIIPVDDEY